MQIGDYAFARRRSIEIPGAKSFGLMLNGRSYLFSEDFGAKDGPWFGASWCVFGGKVQRIAFARDRQCVVDALIKTIREHTP